MSPAGEMLTPVNIPNGKEYFSCGLGSSVSTFSRRVCDDGFIDNGTMCEEDATEITMFGIGGGNCYQNIENQTIENFMAMYSGQNLETYCQYNRIEIIENVKDTVTTSHQVVRWHTNIPTTSQIQYQNLGDNGPVITLGEDTNLKYHHVVTVYGLANNKLHQIWAKSRTPNGQETIWMPANALRTPR